MDRINLVYKIVYPILGLIVGILIIYLGYTIVIDSKPNNEEDTNNNQDSTSNTPPSFVAEFTISEIQDADSLETECLTVINNSVYKIPESWALSHPGGYENIEKICGSDASAIFNNQHESLEIANEQLEKFLVGEIGF